MNSSSGKYTNNESGFEAVMQRVKGVAGTESWSALSEILGIKATALSNRRKNGSIPFAELLEFSRSQNVNFGWLIEGDGAARQRGISPEDASGLPGNEQALLNLFRDLDAADQQAVHGFAAEKRRLRQLEKRVEELAELLKA